MSNLEKFPQQEPERADFSPLLKATVRIQGTLLFHDKDGNVVQTLEIDDTGPVEWLQEAQ